MEMIRYAQLSCLVMSGLLMTSCVSRTVVTNKLRSQIDRPTWSAVETRPDHFIVVAKDPAAEAEAFKELCQKHKFVCLGPEAGGRIVLIERRRK
jgi:hypothetical protein